MPDQPDNTLPVSDLPPQDSTEPVVIDDLTDEAPEVERGRPGPRHRFPPVPESDPQLDEDEELEIERIDPGFQAGAGAGPVQIVRNTVLTAAASNSSTSVVCEPSVASHDAVVLYTGNWFAALSTDSGGTFRYINPYTAFPSPAGMRFCCDQVLQYIPSIDTFAWLLQYTENPQGENVLRLAFAKTADVVQRRWRIYDIRPAALGSPGNMLDFPDMAVGATHLYITTNAFQGETWTASYVIRIPLAQLVSGQIVAQRVVSTQNFAFRVAQQCANVGLWASHVSTTVLRVYSWAQSATFKDVTVPRWLRTGMSSQTGAFNWLGRCDSRILGAALVGGELWFTWGSGRGLGFQEPHTRIARVNAATQALVKSQALASATYAIQYATLAVNTSNEVGASYMFGGGPFLPSHAVGVLTGTPAHAVVKAGTHGPRRQQWGDYLAARRHHPDGTRFSASGYTLQGGDTETSVEPRYVVFTR